jgi:hypothetical protein
MKTVHTCSVLYEPMEASATPVYEISDVYTVCNHLLWACGFGSISEHGYLPPLTLYCPLSRVLTGELILPRQEFLVS